MPVENFMTSACSDCFEVRSHSVEENRQAGVLFTVTDGRGISLN